MPKSVPQTLLEKAARRYEAEIAARKEERGEGKPGRVITISRMFGAGGISVSNLLAEILRWPVWDREVLNVLATASEGRHQARMFESLDEKTQGVIESFLTSVGGGMDKHTYDYLLPRAIYIIAQSDALILGRGAHLLLPGALKVFLKADMRTRIDNVRALLDIDEKKARKEINRRDRERREFLDDLGRRFGRRGPAEDPLEYDLEINTDAFDFQDAADVILTAASTRFKMPRSAGRDS